jgi:tetratricopeptide (TPR) repeat protein
MTQYHLPKIRQAIELKKYEYAIKVLQREIGADPQSHPAFHLLGYCYFALGEYPKSEDCYKTAISFDPNNHGYLTDYGRLFLHQRRMDELEELANRILEINPQSPWPFVFFAQKEILDKNYPKAITFLDQAIALDPNGLLVKSLQLKSMVLTLMGDIEGAQK